MKYNININQKALSQTDIDLKNAAILEYLIYYCNSKSEKIEANKVDGYTWINYKTLLEDMPLLKIKNTNTLTPRIHEIERLGFIKTKEIRHNGFKRLLVKTTRLIDTLIVESEKPNRENEKPNRETKVNNNTIDNNTIDNNTLIASVDAKDKINALLTDNTNSKKDTSSAETNSNSLIENKKPLVSGTASQEVFNLSDIAKRWMAKPEGRERTAGEKHFKYIGWLIDRKINEQGIEFKDKIKNTKQLDMFSRRHVKAAKVLADSEVTGKQLNYALEKIHTEWDTVSKSWTLETINKALTS